MDTQRITKPGKHSVHDDQSFIFDFLLNCSLFAFWNEQDSQLENEDVDEVRHLRQG